MNTYTDELKCVIADLKEECTILRSHLRTAAANQRGWVNVLRQLDLGEQVEDLEKQAEEWETL